MNTQLEELNTLFTDTFNAIMQVEEKNLKRVGEGDLSIAEFHTLECIGNGEENRRTVGEIAETLGVTVPTVTVCVNKLVKKGYVTKTKSERDARIAIVELTPTGERMNRLHRFFHEQMVLSVSHEFSAEEMEYLLRCIRKLNTFFADRV